jgi:prepilin peptidase CpaA
LVGILFSAHEKGDDMSIETAYFLCLGVVFVAVLGFAVLADLRSRQVPNLATIALLGLFILWALPQFSLALVISSVGAFVIALCTTFILWRLDYIGGADVKIFSALALYTGMDGLAGFAGWTAFIGGLVALVLLFSIALRKGPVKAVRDARDRSKVRNSVPYLVAIAGSALIAAFNQDWFRLGALA